MVNWNGSPTMTGVNLSGNEAKQGSGGGMYNRIGSPILTDATFSGNSSLFGGGMLNVFGSPTLTNVTFDDNEADGWGGGISNGVDGILNTGR